LSVETVDSGIFEIEIVKRTDDDYYTLSESAQMVFCFKEDVYNFYYYDYEDIFSFMGGIVASM